MGAYTDKVMLHKMDEVHLIISTEPSIMREMSGYFTFEVPGYKFMPAYKMGAWDGKIRLVNTKDGTIYAGLVSYIKDFCKERGYEFYYEEEPDNNFSVHEAVQFIESLRLPITPRNYQVDAFVAAVRKRRMLLLSPTGSGKSLIIYMLVRYYMQHEQGKKHLIVVPNISLVVQMRKDFGDYGFDEKLVHEIMAGREKETTNPVVISTWQSLYKMPKEYFEQFACIIVDECHGVKSKSLTNIMTKTPNIKYRYGTTGTLDGTQTHKLVIEGLIGAVKKVTETKELIDRKVLSDFSIKAIILKHKEKIPSDLRYQEEIHYLIDNDARNAFIKNLVLSLEGNTLVLFNYVEKHGMPLFNAINKAASNRKVFFVYGGTELAVREEVRATVEQEKNAIIVASAGVYSQGINIRRLNNVVFTHPGKSRIRTLQSIGRALRRVDDTEAVLYDIVDDLTNERKRQNFSLKHFKERFTIYKSEKFKVKTYNVELNNGG